MTTDYFGHLYWFGLGVLAVWRLTHLVHVEHGPWGLFALLRRLAAAVRLGDLFACFYCLSIWIAAPAAWWLASTWHGFVLTWLALSAGAILIEVRGIGAPPNPPPDRFEGEQRDDVLR